MKPACELTASQGHGQGCSLYPLPPWHLPEGKACFLVREGTESEPPLAPGTLHSAFQASPESIHSVWVNLLPELNVGVFGDLSHGAEKRPPWQSSFLSVHLRARELRLPAQAPICLPGGGLSKSFTNLTSCVETEVEKAAHRGCALAGQFLMTGFGLLHERTLVYILCQHHGQHRLPRDTEVVGKDWGGGTSGKPSVSVCPSQEQQALL